MIGGKRSEQGLPVNLRVDHHQFNSKDPSDMSLEDRRFLLRTRQYLDLLQSVDATRYAETQG